VFALRARMGDAQPEHEQSESPVALVRSKGIIMHRLCFIVAAVFAIAALSAIPVSGQSYYGQKEVQYLGQWSENQYDSNSTSNEYGRYGSPYSSESINNPYGKYGSPYGSNSVNNPYSTNAPKLYDANGNYRGRLSNNPYDPESISNPYGRYGSPYSSESINNPYGAGSPYRSDSPNNPYGSGWSIYSDE